jgi:RimJ/RimL family protein N-acetyltransferase
VLSPGRRIDIRPLRARDGPASHRSLLGDCIVDGFSEVEIVWAVARSHWRRGIASRLGQHSPSEVASLGLHSVVAYAREDNVASRGVMTTLGMTYEQSFDFDGLPHVLYRTPLADR